MFLKEKKNIEWWRILLIVIGIILLFVFLITSGQRDLCSPFIAKTMFDNIPNSKWELFQYSGHMPFLEEHEKYIKVLMDWLNKHD